MSNFGNKLPYSHFSHLLNKSNSAYLHCGWLHKIIYVRFNKVAGNYNK